MPAGIRPRVAFVARLDDESSAPQPMDVAATIAAPDGREACSRLARDDERMKRPSKTAVEAPHRAIRQDADS